MAVVYCGYLFTGYEIHGWATGRKVFGRGFGLSYRNTKSRFGNASTGGPTSGCNRNAAYVHDAYIISNLVFNVKLLSLR